LTNFIKIYVKLDGLVDSYYISMSCNDSQNLEFQITPFSLKKTTQFRFYYLKTIGTFSQELLNYILDKYM